MKLKDCITGLPAYALAGRINSLVANQSTLVVTAPPGTGKSTVLPLTLLEALPEGKVLVLEPRRLAARQIAERMAWLCNEPVGQTVGYRIRFEQKVSAQTRVEVLTEGILTRMLVDDPTLEGIGAVVFDEFHERSLHSDEALALTREIQQVLRPDLKIILMSATLDAAALCQNLQATLVECQGQMFPVEMHYTDDLPWNDARLCVTEIVRTVIQAHRQHPGDMLVFLPGEAEIRRCQELLGSSLEATEVLPLYGMLSSEEQRRALAPSSPGSRKIVLATSIAETSLTIEGVRIVIDSGRCRKMVFDARSGLSHLETVPISLDMAIQRTGRAGRVAPGVCYRLWSRQTEAALADCRIPEILEADLAPLLLDVAAWGEDHPERLPWLTPLPRPHQLEAQTLLQGLGALDAQGRITSHGRKLVQLPCHPRIGQMLLSATDRSQRALAADMAALLECATPALFQSGADLREYLDQLQLLRSRHKAQGVWQQIVRASEYYLHLINRYSALANPAETSLPLVECSGRLLAAAYPERIAQAQGNAGHYRLANGDTAFIDTQDELSAHDWVVVAHMNATGQGRVFLGVPVNPKALGAHIRQQDSLLWDNKRGMLVAQREQRIGRLLVEATPLHTLSREDIEHTLCEAALKWGTSMFDFNEQVLQLQRRVATVSRWHPELNLPLLDNETVLARGAEWIPFYAEGRTTTSELKKVDMVQVIWSLLDYEQQQAVDELAPQQLVFPNGRRFKVEYRQGAEQPILRVRLQECFGMRQTPRVDKGRCPVLLELLSPGFKPVQLTQDLESFWAGTYFEVRKELRRRYPKHAWPEDPQTYIDTKTNK